MCNYSDNKKDNEAEKKIKADFLWLDEQSDVTPWTPLNPIENSQSL